MFGRKDSGTRYGALIDVGSGSVGVGIVVSREENELPEILYTCREYMRTGKHKETAADRIRRMREALFAASLRLAEEGTAKLRAYDEKARISHILVTCAAPWATTITRDIHYEHDEPVKITKSLIADLEKSAEDQVEENVSASGLLATLGMRIVERATVEIKLNGYQVHDPFGHKATTVTLSHIAGLVPQEVLDAVYEVREKVFTDTEISAHTYMLVMYCILRDLYPETKSLCIADVTGESTEIGVVEDGVLVGTAQAPYGAHALIREIAAETGGTSEDVMSMLRAYDEGTGSGEMDTIIKAYLEKYDNTIKESLIRLNEEHFIPGTLIVTALPSLQSIFEKRLPVIFESVTESTCATLSLHKQVLDRIAAEENSDPFISLAARFFHKLHGCGEIETL